ncbi:Helix-turn-helix [Cohaesibacter marisflavi]|uniref:Helix-turn-helix n=1 Tax=Cohaesibacter marisflavi TaxID=655353 RepID=A0A1I5ABL3_9HYPH|nr:helix-turn-helix transcriptional regulator [Cohaesibacter marisflavi]SFN59822.1 Helix-turn-helix [Cohaesibacter marisflavi]
MKNTNPSSQENVGERLLWLIEIYLETTQTEFAKSIGEKKATINNWIKGPQRLSLQGALKINALYGTSLDFLFLGRVDTLPQKMATAWMSRPLESNSAISSENPDA